MKKYRPKKLIPGHKVEERFKGKELIAIPLKKVLLGVEVFYQDGRMEVNNFTPCLTKLNFKDKYDRNIEYTLCYYEWKPEVQQKLL